MSPAMTQYFISVLTEGAIFGIMALGLNVIWGWSGDFDLAYYGYVAVGAYMTLVLTVGPAVPPAEYILGLHLPYPLAVVFAVVTAMAVGLIVGLIALRHLRGIYFTIVTLGAVYVMYIITGQYTPLFDGFNGLGGLFDPMGDWFGLDYQSWQYFFLGVSLAMLVLVYIFMARVSASRFGIALRTLREDERAAAAFGRDIYRLKLKGYVLGAGIGGFAGALFAAYVSAFNPTAWSPVAEVVVLYAMVLVGGRGNIRGVVLGVVIIGVLVQESTRFLPMVPGQPAALHAFLDAHPQVLLAARGAIIGLVLVLFLRFRPQGLLPERRFVDRQPAPPEIEVVSRTA
jgi:branched-chain amino acid transport system permease protein